MLPILKRSKTSETQRLIKKIRFLKKKVEGGDVSQKEEMSNLEQQLDIIKVSRFSVKPRVLDKKLSRTASQRLDLQALVVPLLSLKLRKHARLRQHLPLPSDFFPRQRKAARRHRLYKSRSKTGYTLPNLSAMLLVRL